MRLSFSLDFDIFSVDIQFICTLTVINEFACLNLLYNVKYNFISNLFLNGIVIDFGNSR